MRLTPAIAALALVAGLGGCAASPGGATADALAQGRHAALAAVLPMPEASQFEVRYFDWLDRERQRAVPAKLYLPANAHGPVPLVLVSHGMGGSREGYTYLGQYWAARGYASLHLQHTGSDRTLWTGNPLALVTRLQDAAHESEALERVRDLRFGLDQLLAGALAPRIDTGRILAAGHSYGANTVLLAAGARVLRGGQPLDLRDARIRAAVLISAPPFYGESDPAPIWGAVQIPTLHITATDDDIRIPGYPSGVQDREAGYAWTGSARKALAVFRDGSHSMFTDRLGTGGVTLNPQVKVATRELALAFWSAVLDGQADALAQWQAQHQGLVSRFESHL